MGAPSPTAVLESLANGTTSVAANAARRPSPSAYHSALWSSIPRRIASSSTRLSLPRRCSRSAEETQARQPLRPKRQRTAHLDHVRGWYGRLSETRIVLSIELCAEWRECLAFCHHKYMAMIQKLLRMHKRLRWSAERWIDLAAERPILCIERGSLGDLQGCKACAVQNFRLTGQSIDPTLPPNGCAPKADPGVLHVGIQSA